jgi:hypothetical protein
MRYTRHLIAALIAASALASGPAFANSCQAGPAMCPTAMPIGGYCECTMRGKTEGGTVVSPPATRQPANAGTGGCGAHPNAPGCH